jgi:hypothetical protein
MRTRKYFTIKEWNRFKSNDYFDIQEMLCQKYDVILTDYQTKREKVFSALKKINLKNFDKGVTEFSKLVQFFGGSLEQLTREIDSPKRKGSHYKKTTPESNNDDVPNSIWGGSDNSVPIWGGSENDFDSKHKDNLDKIWGKIK